MRNGQNKRIRGRNRKGQNPLTRVYESNGPEVKIRGTAHHIAEKYLQLARDAQGSGDPVTAENHFQHAEHYLRMIAAAQEQFRAQNPYYQAPPAPGEIRDEAFDGDEGDDGQPGQGQPAQGQPAQGQPSFGQQNFNNNHQPPYPAREQPQPYGSQQPGSNYQGRSQQQPQQNQDIAIDENVAAGQLPPGADIETLPPDESSVDSNGELAKGDDNPDVNDLGNSH